MKLSSTQQALFDETKDFLLDRLNQILKISNSVESKEAFFFIIGITLTEKEICVMNLVNLFYKEDEYKSIRHLFFLISRLIQTTDSDSIYVKAITDPRFFSNESPHYQEDLKQEFAQQLKIGISEWMHEKAPNMFFEKKYPLLYIKHIDLSAPAMMNKK